MFQAWKNPQSGDGTSIFPADSYHITNLLSTSTVNVRNPEHRKKGTRKRMPFSIALFMKLIPQRCGPCLP